MVSAVIVAAGSGLRMGRPGGKQFRLLLGKPVVLHTLLAFESASLVDRVIFVTAQENMQSSSDLVRDNGLRKVASVLAGGVERQDSVRNGLGTLDEAPDNIVVIHDGARPLVTPSLIDKSIENLGDADGLVVGLPAADTIKLVCEGIVQETLDRNEVWQVQTPQVFPLQTIKQAHARAVEEGFYGTDDAGLVERVGGRVKVLVGSEENLKITTEADLLLAEAILSKRLEKGSELEGVG